SRAESQGARNPGRRREFLDDSGHADGDESRRLVGGQHQFRDGWRAFAAAQPRYTEVRFQDFKCDSQWQGPRRVQRSGGRARKNVQAGQAGTAFFKWCVVYSSSGARRGGFWGSSGTSVPQRGSTQDADGRANPESRCDAGGGDPSQINLVIG